MTTQIQVLQRGRNIRRNRQRKVETFPKIVPGLRTVPRRRRKPDEDHEVVNEGGQGRDHENDDFLVQNRENDELQDQDRENDGLQDPDPENDGLQGQENDELPGPGHAIGNDLSGVLVPDIVHEIKFVKCDQGLGLEVARLHLVIRVSAAKIPELRAQESPRK